MKPHLDTRFGQGLIKSRAGLEMKADVLIVDESSLQGPDYSGVNCILVDEAQFLSAKVIDELRRIALDHDIPILCYGLRTDFKSHLFEGSLRLMELADSIEEVKATCHYCNRKSIMNLKHVDGIATSEGASVELGSEEKYFPACYKCYRREIDKARILKLAGASTHSK
jgi:thymidine kinase